MRAAKDVIIDIYQTYPIEDVCIYINWKVIFFVHLFSEWNIVIRTS